MAPAPWVSRPSPWIVADAIGDGADGRSSLVIKSAGLLRSCLSQVLIYGRALSTVKVQRRSARRRGITDAEAGEQYYGDRALATRDAGLEVFASPRPAIEDFGRHPRRLAHISFSSKILRILQAVSQAAEVDC